MVINCPSCKARYRLKRDKLEGRGAKITCPKCAHVFVIFSEGTAGQTRPEDEERVNDEREAIRQRIAEATRTTDTVTGAFAAVLGDDEGVTASSTGKIRVVAPGPRNDRKAVATKDPREAEASEDSASEEAQSGEDSSENEVLEAGSLDFRSVGISTWKVKVAIGLIYDFSDIATLKKYLDDKKVTPDDLISHNAKDWVRIGEIEDLDQHFINVYKTARTATGGGKKKESAGQEDFSSLETAETSTVSGTGSHGAAGSGTGRAAGTYTPPAAKKSAPRRRKQPQEEEKKSRAGLYGFAALLLGALAFFFLGGEDSTPGPAAPPAASAAAPGNPSQGTEDLSAGDRDAIREEIRAKMQRRQEEIQATLGVEEPPVEDDFLAEEERQKRLVPVAPSEKSNERGTSADSATNAGGSSMEAPKPKYRKPIGQAGRTQNVPQPPRSRARVEGQQGQDKGQIYLKAGQKKLDQGDAGSALTMFKKALEKSPNCSACWNGLSKAHRALGQDAEADRAASKAKASGQ